ncbi:MAG: DUF1311 domain-containing protein [Filimonas sp.]|nr:DUF1311 domain-containing protein [Filimonas sp.]
MRKIIFCLFSFICTLTIVNAQITTHTLDSINNSYQACLDKGQQMIKCTSNYYAVMDSLLNIVYNAVRRKMDSTGRNALKADQLKWLKQRDIFFAKKDAQFEQKTKSGEWGRDDRLIIYDEKAIFVEKRVEYLMTL